ncbi:hypothetical protein BDV93DRAFT_471203, partial [Ceratobasidium sp. AG-I]
MSTRRTTKHTGSVALELLRLTAASADVFPPLKHVAGGGLHIAEIIELFHPKKQEWKDFGDYVQNATAGVIDSLTRVDTLQTELEDRLTILQRTIEETIISIEARGNNSGIARVLETRRDREKIGSLRKALEEAIASFELGSTVTTPIDVEKTLDAVIANSKHLSGTARDTAATAVTTDSIMIKVTSISQETSRIAQSATLEKLRYVQDASWDPYRTCLPDTRVKVLDDIFAWINEPKVTTGAQIYLLTAVAGAGKSTIAHTVAQYYADRGELLSSFFFDRESEGRNTPTALFTTMAADLSRVSAQLADRITAAIENERGLPQARLSRQFQELVLKPCVECLVPEPLVIVIDALDE